MHQYRLWHRKLVLLSLAACLLGCSGIMETGRSGDRAKVSLSKFIGYAFNGPDIAWFTTVQGDLFRTEDGGQGWKRISGDLVGGVQQVTFISNQSGRAINKQGQVWRSSDGGSNWQRIGSVEPTEVDVERSAYIVFQDEYSGWVVNGSFVWRSEDGGHKWQRCSPSEALDRMGIDLGRGTFLKDGKAWIGTSGGMVCYTDDGGNSWSLKSVTSSRAQIYDVIFINDKTGWASGWPNGGIYNTRDAGESWQSQLQAKPDDRMQIRSIYFLNKESGWAVGQAWSNTYSPGTSDRRWGIVFNTVDGGQSWRQTYSDPSEEFFNKIYFADLPHGWLVAKNRVYRTDDGGKTWKVSLQVDD